MNAGKFVLLVLASVMLWSGIASLWLSPPPSVAAALFVALAIFCVSEAAHED